MFTLGLTALGGEWSSDWSRDAGLMFTAGWGNHIFALSQAGWTQALMGLKFIQFGGLL